MKRVSDTLIKITSINPENKIFFIASSANLYHLATKMALKIVEEKERDRALEQILAGGPKGFVLNQAIMLYNDIPMNRFSNMTQFKRKNIDQFFSLATGIALLLNFLRAPETLRQVLILHEHEKWVSLCLNS